MLIKCDVLKSIIITDNPKLLKSLCDLYAFKIEGANYSPQYKRGVWDGKKRFISDSGVFSSGLLSRLLEDLKRVNIVPTIEYETCSSDLYIKDITLQNWVFRSHQEELIKKALEAKRAILKAPTGFGKTSVIAYFIDRFKDKNVLVLFNRTQLITQTYDFLTKVIKVPYKIGLAFGGVDEGSNITLASVHSLEKVVGTPAEFPDILIVDEAHEFCSGKLTSQVINAFPTAKYRFALTATVPTDKVKLYTLEGAFGPVVSSIDTQELINEGYLAKPIIQIIPVTCSSAPDNTTYLDWYKDYIVTSEYRNNLIKTIVMKALEKPNSKIAIIANSLEHAQKLNDLLPNSIKLEGKDSLANRKEAIQDFVKGKYRVLIGTNILQTGVDIKEITHLINARGLKSETPTIQALGRALRVDKDPIVYVYDFLDEDGWLLEKHSRSRIRAYKKEGHIINIMPRISNGKDK
jgi:superfamily II DNA or RNA helicase